MKTIIILFTCIISLSQLARAQCPTINNLSVRDSLCAGDQSIIRLEYSSGVDPANLSLFYAQNQYPSRFLYDSTLTPQDVFALPDTLVSSGPTASSFEWLVPDSLSGRFFVYAILSDTSGLPSGCDTLALPFQARATTIFGDLSRVEFEFDSLVCSNDSAEIRAILPFKAEDSVTVTLTSPGVSFGIRKNSSSGTVRFPISGPVQVQAIKIEYANQTPCNDVFINQEFRFSFRPNLRSTSLEGDTTLCFMEEALLQLDLPFNTPGQFSDVSVRLNSGDTFEIPDSLTGETFLLSVLNDESFDYSIESISYSNGPACEQEQLNDIATVTMRPDLSLGSFEMDTVCTGESATLTICLPDADVAVIANISNLTDPLTIPASQTCFPFTVTPDEGISSYAIQSLRYDDALQCQVQNIANGEISVNAQPTASFDQIADICFREELCVSSTSTSADNLAGFEWSFGSSLSSKSSDTCVVFPDNVASFEVALTVTTDKGCSNTFSQQVNQNLDGPSPAQIVKVSKDGDPGVILVALDTAGQSISSYSWFNQDGTPLSSGTNVNVNYVYISDGSAEVYVETMVENAPCVSRSNVFRLENLEDSELIIEELKLFPNPGNGIFSVSLSNSDFGMGEIMITDLNGKRLWKRTIEKTEMNWEEEIETDLLPGHYLFIYQLENQSPVYKQLIIK